MIWRVELGASLLYVIQDGRSERNPHELFIGSTPESWVGHESYLNERGMLPNCYTCYLFDTGSALVMVDTGFGYNAPEGTDAGHMPAALAALDISPRDIDHVVFTHLHPDHILGSLDSARAPLFVDAVHWTLQREVEFWRNGTDDRSAGITAITAVLDDAGLLNAAENPGEILPEVTTMATYGHSPGHTAVRVGSGDDAVVIAGDITFSPVQIRYPGWSVPFDVDKPAAAATRAAFFDMLAASGGGFIAGHYAEPGYGRIVVTSEDRRYEALPAQLISPSS